MPLAEERKTIVIAKQTRDDIRDQITSLVGKSILFSDASFLLVVGSIQLLFELLGHFFGIGPLATAFFNSPYTIGFFEAHGSTDRHPSVPSSSFGKEAILAPVCYACSLLAGWCQHLQTSRISEHKNR